MLLHCCRFSDVNTPLLELLRLVKLYSAGWEEQSITLKKLHADNEGLVKMHI